MDRLRWKLNTGAREHIVQAVREAPLGHVVEIRPETRSDAQNRLLWPLLTDVSNQVIWYERQLAPGEWKNGFVMGLQGAEFVPGLNPGSVWPLGLSTSVMSKERFSNLIELIYAFGAERSVRFRTDKQTFDAQGD